MECPRLDFSDPMGTSAMPSKMRVMLINSVRSPRVVPWHGTRRARYLAAQARPSRRRAASRALALLRRYEQTASSAIVAEADPPDDAEYGVGIGDRVVQPPEHQDGRAFGRHQSVRVRWKGRDLPNDSVPVAH